MKNKQGERGQVKKKLMMIKSIKKHLFSLVSTRINS